MRPESETRPHTPIALQKPPRVVAVDLLRGLAIIGVIFYHFAWDLRYLNFIGVNVESEPGWLFFARALLAAFLFLTGFSLVLAHGANMRWPAFWRRFAFIAGAAALVTLGTYILFPDAFVFFGVLHAIALFSLMAVPFLRAPAWLSFGVGVVWLTVGLIYKSEVFNVWYLSLIGFWTVPPLTQDLVPIFPGFGFTLFGVALAKRLIGSGRIAQVAAFRPDNGVARVLKWAGRWSLLIYLVHQPVLLGVLTPLAGVIAPGQERRADNFLSSCQSHCEAGAGEAGYCTRYCACSLEQIETGDLWALIEAPEITVEQSSEINSVTQLCSAMARE